MPFKKLQYKINFCLEVYNILNRDLKVNRKRIGDCTSKITNWTPPIIMWKLKEKMTLRMHYQLEVVLIHHKTTLNCRRFMNRFISCLTLRNKPRERKRQKIGFYRKSTIKITSINNLCFRFWMVPLKGREDN